MTTDREWMKDAACRGAWELFDEVESVGGRYVYPHLERARAICETCPVFWQCAEASEGEVSGIWAGLPK